MEVMPSSSSFVLPADRERAGGGERNARATDSQAPTNLREGGGRGGGGMQGFCDMEALPDADHIACTKPSAACIDHCLLQHRLAVE